MYSTKYKVNPKADQGRLSINVSGKKGGDVPRSRISRFEGRQFSLPMSSKPFSTYDFSVGKDPYCPANSYRNAPKKLGFGSSEPPKRDEFSNTIAIEQYREAIKSVNKSASQAAKKILAERIASGEEFLPDEVVQREEEQEEVFEYDQAHSVKPDVVGKPRTWSQIKLGSLRTTNTSYGVDCKVPPPRSTVFRTTASASFFNNNHLRVGGDEAM